MGRDALSFGAQVAFVLAGKISVAGHHLGDDETRAKTPRDATHPDVGATRHGRQHRLAADQQRTYAQVCLRQVPIFCAIAILHTF